MSISVLNFSSRPTVSHYSREKSSSVIHRLGGATAVVVDWVIDRLQDQREQALLMQMGDRELKDIGLSRADIGSAYEQNWQN